MSNTSLTRRWGDGSKNPSLIEMMKALEELSTHDPEHPDCWLADEDGWSISVFESGLIILQNLETDEGPWRLENRRREEALKLWQLLQAGDIGSIREKDWLEGYGSPGQSGD